MLEDEGTSFDEKQAAFHQLLHEDIAGYMQRFQQGQERSITDDSYKLWDFMQLLNRLILPYAGFIRQGLREGRIAPASGITQENAEAYTGPTCVLVSGDTTVEDMEYTIRLIYTGSAE